MDSAADPMTALLMPRPRPPADDEPATPPTGRVPTGDVPQAWRGIGGLMGERPPPGPVYGRSIRKRALIRLAWVVLTLSLVIAGVLVVAVAALVKVLLL